MGVDELQNRSREAVVGWPQSFPLMTVGAGCGKRHLTHQSGNVQGSYNQWQKTYQRERSKCLWISRPLDFIAKLAAVVPKPRVNPTRFHGVFAPNSKHRIQVTPAKRGKGKKTHATDEPSDQTATERHAAMTWAQRLKRVFTKSRRLRRY